MVNLNLSSLNKLKEHKIDNQSQDNLTQNTSSVSESDILSSYSNNDDIALISEIQNTTSSSDIVSSVSSKPQHPPEKKQPLFSISDLVWWAVKTTPVADISTKTEDQSGPTIIENKNTESHAIPRLSIDALTGKAGPIVENISVKEEIKPISPLVENNVIEPKSTWLSISALTGKSVPVEVAVETKISETMELHEVKIAEDIVIEDKKQDENTVLNEQSEIISISEKPKIGISILSSTPNTSVLTSEKPESDIIENIETEVKWIAQDPKNEEINMFPESHTSEKLSIMDLNVDRDEESKLEISDSISASPAIKSVFSELVSSKQTEAQDIKSENNIIWKTDKSSTGDFFPNFDVMEWFALWEDMLAEVSSGLHSEQKNSVDGEKINSLRKRISMKSALSRLNAIRRLFKSQQKPKIEKESPKENVWNMSSKVILLKNRLSSSRKHLSISEIRKNKFILPAFTAIILWFTLLTLLSDDTSKKASIIESSGIIDVVRDIWWYKEWEDYTVLTNKKVNSKKEFRIIKNTKKNVRIKNTSHISESTGSVQPYNYIILRPENSNAISKLKDSVLFLSWAQFVNAEYNGIISDSWIINDTNTESGSIINTGIILTNQIPAFETLWTDTLSWNKEITQSGDISNNVKTGSGLIISDPMIWLRRLLQ